MDQPVSRAALSRAHRRLVGQNIALARQLQQISQQKLAARLDVARSQLSEWERGVHEPRRPMLAHVAQVLDRPLGWFYENHVGGAPGADFAKRLFDNPVQGAAVMAMTTDLVLTGWNQACSELFGWRVDEAIGQRADELILGDDGRDGRLRTLREDGGYVAPARLTTKSGADVDVEVIAFSVSDGPLLSYVVICRKID